MALGYFGDVLKWKNGRMDSPAQKNNQPIKTKAVRPSKPIIKTAY